MKITIAAEVEQSQMQPLEVEPQSKLVEEEVRSTYSKLGVETYVDVQNENTKAIVEHLEAQDVVQ